MPLNLRKMVVRNGVITGLVCLALSLGLSLFNGGLQFNLANHGWPILAGAGYWRVYIRADRNPHRGRRA